MEAILRGYIEGALAELGITEASITLERPALIEHGDWSTNIALASAKKLGKDPRALAGAIIQKLSRSDLDISYEVAGPGFINIKLGKKYFIDELSSALGNEHFGNNEVLGGKKVIVEYTDPNPFKEFHIGHLMSNAVGESISRLVEASGAETKRACYQGDVGLHVAKAVWFVMENDSPRHREWLENETERLASWEYLLQAGIAYSRGNFAYETDPEAKKNIIEINKKIYERVDTLVTEKYDFGRKKSLEYFERIYKRLGTDHGAQGAFDFYFFESKTGPFGKELVEKHPDIFELSDGAIVYKGDESKGLHTRVFINKDGLPTYEAKELGLAKIKYDTYPYDISIVITGNEVNDYFRVLLDAMGKVFPELAEKTEHYSHGMLRLPTGKMSSRTGDVITAESLIEDVKEHARGKITSENLSEDERADIAEKVAIGAIKYSILRQATGKDIIFDFDKSLSFEGDSGPYLQYTYARTQSLLARAGDKSADARTHEGDVVPTLHKYLLRFPEVVQRAEREREPHYVATHLIEVARMFNSFYGNTTILDGARDEPYKLALTALTARVLSRGLWLLGIPVPERM